MGVSWTAIGNLQDLAPLREALLRGAAGSTSEARGALGLAAPHASGGSGAFLNELPGGAAGSASVVHGARGLAAPPAGGGGGVFFNELSQLMSWRAQGFLTEDEFSCAKQRLLRS